jgi:hypothetical protein
VSYSFGPGEAVEVVTIFPFFGVASALNRRLRGSRHIDPAIASSTHAEQRHFTDQAARKDDIRLFACRLKMISRPC